MSHFQIPATTQSNSRYGGSSFYNNSANTSFQKSQLNYSANTSFNGGGQPSSVLYSTKSKKIPSRNSWNHTFSIPIQCGKSNYENPDLELWKDPHVTRLQTGNSRRIVCGGLSWDIYIHPNQGENGNEFALSCFPVKSGTEDKLPENYRLKYTVSTSLNSRGSPQNGHLNDDQKSISQFDASWDREISHVVYDANPSDISAKHRPDIDWRATMQRLPFSINNLLQYNCDEDNDYFNLYIQIKTEFIKKPAKRSQYVGVLGAILLESELKLEEKDKQLQEHKEEINQLNHKKDAFIMELQKQLQTANKLNFQLTDKYSMMTQSIDKYASEMQELRREIQNIANRNKQSVTAKEKTIMHLQDDIVSKNAEISQLMQKVTRLQAAQQNAVEVNQLMQTLQAQQLQSQHLQSHAAVAQQQHLLQQQRVQQQQQFKQQLLAQQNIQQRVQQQQPMSHPFIGPQSPTSHPPHVSSAAQVGSNYNTFSAQQAPPQSSSAHPTHANMAPNASTTAVVDRSPQSMSHSMSHSQQQSPSYQARVVSQPSFNTNTKSTSGGGGGMTSSPPQMHSSNIVESFSFGTISPEKNQILMPDLERNEEKKQQQPQLPEPLPQPHAAISGNSTGNTTQDTTRTFDPYASGASMFMGAGDEQEEEAMVEEATISDKVDPAMEEEIYQHRPVKAWRYDSEQKKWRGRGKGQLTVYLHNEREMAKIVFMDEKHDKVRLLQWIDGDTHCKVSPEDGDKKEVEWFGADYTMDLKDPMSGQWKLCFLEDETAAQAFMEVFNRCVDDAMATRSMNSKETKEDRDDNDEDKASESSTKPFSFEVIDKKKPESFVNDESLTFNPFNTQTVGQWTDTFKQSDAADAVATNASGSFANMNWDFQPQPNVDHETTDNKERNVEEDQGLKPTFKPIVQLEEQKVDTGHEEETLIIEIQFLKLYRFGKDVAQMPCWKIRASKSTVFFYKSNANGKIRMIAREQETSKLRMNQFVPKSEDAVFNTKQANVYQWKAYDSSIAAEEEDENAGFTNWCIKFGDTTDANTFATEFKKAMQVNDSISAATNDDDNNNNETVPIETEIEVKEENDASTISNLSNEVEPTQNHVNEAADANGNEAAEDERYKGWSQEEIAADKLRQERAKQGQEAAKLFQGSTDANANPQTTWEMPGDLFSANNADNPIPDVFSNYDFESQRGVDLEAEKVMNRIQTDASISFGVSGNHVDESSNVVQDFSNVTSRDNEVEVEKPQSGLGLTNFAFDAGTEEEVTASTWGDGSGGFSSVKPTEGFSNVNWANDDGGGFGSFGDSGGFSIDGLMSDTKRANLGENTVADDSPKKGEDNALDFKIKADDNTNKNDAEDNGNYTLKPIVSLEEVEVETGHDNERILDEFQIAKLYRWGKDVAGIACWKARAQKTSLKCYQDIVSGRIRMVCRENITNKLRLNQNIAPPDIAKLEKKNEKQISWSGFDVTIEAEDQDDRNGLCMFAAKFIDEETATKFHTLFTSSSQNNEQLTSNANN